MQTHRLKPTQLLEALRNVNSLQSQRAWPAVALAILGSIRQFRYPREYRIGQVRMPPGARRAVREALRSALSPPASLPLPGSPLQADSRFIEELCTRLWRLDQRFAKLRSGDESPELQQLENRFADVQDVLRAAGFELHDYTGQRYDPGLTVRVLTYQPTAGIAAGQEIILETIKPTVYYHGRLLASGEVIVGVSMPKGGEQDGA